MLRVRNVDMSGVIRNQSLGEKKYKWLKMNTSWERPVRLC